MNELAHNIEVFFHIQLFRITQDSTLFYCSLLGQHGPCCNKTLDRALNIHKQKVQTMRRAFYFPLSLQPHVLKCLISKNLVWEKHHILIGI